MKRLCLLFFLAAACGDDDRVATDASTADVAISDGGGTDAGPPDVDAGTADTGTTDAGSNDAALPGPDVPSLAMVELTFAGCAPDLSGDVVVVRNAESIAVSSTGGAFGSIQLALQDERGSVALGTQHRVDTGAVINVVSGTTWTNIAMDSAGVLSGDVADPIGGTLSVDTYDESAGMLDVTFNAVTLQNPSDGSVCQIDGRLRTSGLSF